MKLKTTIALAQADILNIVKTHLEAQGYKLLTKLELNIQDSSGVGMYDDYESARIKSITAEVEK